jgi:hypothetical protein
MRRLGEDPDVERNALASGGIQHTLNRGTCVSVGHVGSLPCGPVGTGAGPVQAPAQDGR